MSFKRLFHLSSDEKVRLALWPHRIVLLPHILLLILALGAPVVGIGLFFNGVPSLDNIWAHLGFVLVASAYCFSIWLFFFTQLVNYYLDVSLITDRRIIDVHQEGLFRRSVSELEMARIQDVTSEVNGIGGTILDYGKVTVQSAGEQEHFIFDKVPHPHKVRELILELAHKDREREGKSIVAEAIEQHE
jgi:uncharacterized membrane protein YdbT with pleckstrin-like domain